MSSTTTGSRLKAAVPQVDAVGFEQKDGAEHLRGLLLDDADQHVEHLRQRRTHGDQLERSPLAFEQGLGLLARGDVEGESPAERAAAMQLAQDEIAQPGDHEHEGE